MARAGTTWVLIEGSTMLAQGTDTESALVLLAVQAAGPSPFAQRERVPVSDAIMPSSPRST